MSTVGPAYLARRVPGGLLGALFAVLLLEWLLGHYGSELGDELAYSWRFALRAAHGPPGRSQVLCLGDSIAKTGLLARVLEERIGRSVYNLGVLRGQAAGTYYLLREAIVSGARPEAVIVDFHTNLLAASARTNVANWPELLGPGEILELAWLERDPGLPFRVAAPWILPTARNREGIRASVRTFFGGESPEGLAQTRVLRRNWTANAGSFVVAPRPWETPREVAPNSGWKPRRSNEVYLEKFLELARAHGIRVFWVLPPAVPEWRERRERLGIEAFYSEYVETWQRRFPELLVVDARNSPYPHRAFYDEVHLNRIGATVFSAALAEAIAPYLVGESRAQRPAWIALAPFQDRNSGSPAEDVQESRLAVAREAGRFR